LGGLNIYDFLINCVETEYDTVETLKESERGRVDLIRHRGSGTLYVFRRFRGSGGVHGKLISLSCKNLPRVYEAAEKDGNVAVLEEYISGDSLAFLLRGALFSEAEARDVGLQLCSALWALQSIGAVHRDVKPENVIMRGADAVLIDFDASRLYDPSRENDTTVLGTTGYAAPEQYGLSQTDGRADIYSLGVLLNVMLTGEHPSKRLAPGRMGRIVRRCTMVNPDSRYKNALSLMEAL
jgi:serine/threonine protein kinase